MNARDVKKAKAYIGIILICAAAAVFAACASPAGGNEETGTITISLAAVADGPLARFSYPPKTADLAQLYGALTLTKDGVGTSHRFWGDKGITLTSVAAGNYTISLKVYYYFGERIANDSLPADDTDHMLLAESAGGDPKLSFTLAGGENKTVLVTVYKKFTPAVEITPPIAVVAFGKTAHFHAYLATGTDLHLDDEFTWALEGNTDAGISINAASGLLTVASSVTAAANFTVRATSKTDSALTETAAVTVKAPDPMPGNPSISGDNWVNGILMANLPGTFTEPGTVSFKWKRGADSIGMDSDEYTVTAQDAGEPITVEIEHSAYSGNATSAPINILNNKIAVTSDTHWGNLAAVMNAMPTNTNYEVHVTGNHNGNGYTSNTFGNKTGITVDIKGTVINGENSQITLAGQGSLLYIGANQTVTMSGLNLVGHEDNNTALVYINGTNAKFTMNSGSVKDSTNTVTSTTTNGGGVYQNGGTFTMTGVAEVTGNTATIPSGNVGFGASGGGVYVYSGTFIMENSAKVSGNTVSSGMTSSGGNITSSGGGVAVISGTFTMSGNAEVSGNVSKGINGNGGGSSTSGGVGVGSGSTFTMSGNAKVSGNTAAGNGGGLSVAGTFIMNGGEVSNNTGNCGGMYLSGTFIMNDGKVSNNISTSIAGGVYVYGGVGRAAFFTMTGGEVSGNTGNNGGGVYAGLNGTFNMKGGEVKGNTATNSGWNTGAAGGVMVSGGFYNMTGGKVLGNTAATNGGGVHVVYGTTYPTMFRIENGIVYGSGAGADSNTAATGAALYKDTTDDTAQYGTFGPVDPDDPDDDGWVPATDAANGVLDTRDATIEVENGVLLP